MYQLTKLNSSPTFLKPVYIILNFLMYFTPFITKLLSLSHVQTHTHSNLLKNPQLEETAYQAEPK